MRISSDSRDSGHTKYQEVAETHCRGDKRRIHVLLDGLELKDVVTADEELGEVLVYYRDADGKLVPSGNELTRQWRYGDVEVRVDGWER